MIRILESYFPLGWWVGVGKNLGKIYEVDRTKKLEHFAWIFKGKNWKLLGLTKEQTLCLMNDRVPGSADISMIPRIPGRDYVAEAKIILREDWMQAIYHYRGHAYFTVTHKDSKFHEAAVAFLMQMPLSQTKNCVVSVYDHANVCIWDRIPFEEAISTKRF